jgi:hypothetical protein
MVYMVTFTINIPPMLAYIPATWILWEMKHPNVMALANLGVFNELTSLAVPGTAGSSKVNRKNKRLEALEFCDGSGQPMISM